MLWRFIFIFFCFAPLANATEPVRSRGIQDVLAALDQYPVNKQKRDAAQTVLATPLPDPASAEDHLKYARAALTLGLSKVRIEQLRAAISLGGGNNPGYTWKELSDAELNGGNFQQAIEARQQAIRITPPKWRGQLLGDYVALSNQYRIIGDSEKQKAAVKEAENLLSILRNAKGWEQRHFKWEANIEFARGWIEYSAGRYPEAEARFRRALSLNEQFYDNLKTDEQDKDTNNLQDSIDKKLDGATTWLAMSLAQQGRLAEAEIYARKAVLSAIGRGGQDGADVAKRLETLTYVFSEQGRLEEALILIGRIRQNIEFSGVAPNSFPMARMYRLRAGMLAGLQRWPEALADYEASINAVADDPDLSIRMNIPSIGWIRALQSEKRGDEALAKAQQLHKLLQKRMGDNAYETAEALGYVGAILVSKDRDNEGIPRLRQALAVMIPAVSQESDRSGRRFSRLNFIINNYLKALARIRGTPLETSLGLNAAGEAFTVADVLRGQAVQQAMQASSVRAAAGNPALSELVRREQDSRQERDAIYTVLADLLSRPAEQSLPQTTKLLQQKAAGFDSTAKAAIQEIRQKFPEYADLTAPKSVSISEVQSALQPGEALISILPTDDQTLIWAIPAKGQASFAASAISNKEINSLVGTLRQALDPGDFTLEQMPAFNPQAAHRLFTALLQPVAKGWQGAEHLFIATGGALGRLPLAVLLTESAPLATHPAGLPLAHYRNWPWLIRQHAISQLPSAASLLTLRRMAKGDSNRSAFIGFGDPDFAGSTTITTGATRRLRAVKRSGDSNQEMNYSSIPPLPDTRVEILALAKTLEANPEHDVYLGKQASRDNVLKADLSKRKIVAFATHGLLTGEYPGINQPALALANPGGGQHGLLLLDDILTLKLDADWVILSACNTAGGDGHGGEAISGLGRGFFYSGSRSLLVTHWPVESVSAQKLVVGVFEEISKNPKYSRANALRQSMLHLMNTDGKEGKFTFAYAHPLFWAPYALVGDGGN